MITKQMILNELKLFLNELKKSNQQLDREAYERKEEIRRQYAVKHPDNHSDMCSTHIFYYDWQLKMMKRGMFSIFIGCFICPFLFIPLSNSYHNRYDGATATHNQSIEVPFLSSRSKGQ